MNLPQNINSEIASAIQLLSVDCIKNRKIAIAMIESVIAAYDTKQYPSFSVGLAGIGCGIQYVIKEKIIQAVADEVLAEIDENLFLSVYFRDHLDLSHATGLTGIASYFFYRLEDEKASDGNLCTLTCKSALLSILDILSARFGLNGYSYPLFYNQLQLSRQEKVDIKSFLLQFIQYDICDSQAVRALEGLSSEGLQNTNIPTCLVSDDLSDVTIIIPIRIDSLERKENLNTILSLYTLLTNINIIILEADIVQSVDVRKYGMVEYIFRKDDNPVFYRTHYLNEMIKLAKTPILAVWDADVFVPLEQLHQSVDAIRRGQNVLSYPFDGMCYNIPADISICFRNQLNFSVLESGKMLMPTLFGLLTVGGVFLVNREEYIKAGMENEFFVGWGPEDSERLKRITILGLPVLRVRGAIYHLWHPRKLNSGFIDNNQNLQGKKELIRICRMTKQELQAEISTWKWIYK